MSKMQCAEAREFFSPYMDGELAQADMAVLEGHLAVCPECRDELSQWQQLSRAMGQLKTPVSAPAGFAAAVMAKAAGQKTRPLQGVRRWVAAAAAVAVLAAGTAGFAARGLWQQLPMLVGNQPGQHQVAGGQGQIPGMVEPENPPGTDLQTGGGEGSKTAPGGNATGNGETTGGQEPAVGGNDNPGSSGRNGPEPVKPQEPARPDDRPVTVAEKETYTARVFLSDGHKAESTLMKIKVADTAAARKQTVELAAAYGASVQFISEQDDGSTKRLIYQLAVAKEKADALMMDLGRIGELNTRTTSTKDMSREFRDFIEQYQAKVAQANSAADPGEKERLLEEAKVLEQQLTTWEKEVKNHNIILWLET